jgi:antitoxin HicB
MLTYPITLTADSNGTLLVGFPDFPEANSVGDDETEAMSNALDALRITLEIYFDAQRPVPAPSIPLPGQRVIAIPTLETAKVLLWNEMFLRK